MVQYRKRSVGKKGPSISIRNCNINKKKSATQDSEVQLEHTWRIDEFSRQVKSLCCHNGSSSESNFGDLPFDSTNTTKTKPQSTGFDSKPFVSTLNGVQTTWNISIRYLTDQNGETILNPLVLCLNMLPSYDQSVGVLDNASIKYQFSILNNHTNKYEMETGFAGEEKPMSLTNCPKMKSIGYKTMRIKKSHIDVQGGLTLTCKLNIRVEDSAKPQDNLSHLSFKSTTHNGDEKPDLIIESYDGVKFHVHKSMLPPSAEVFKSDLDKTLFEITKASSTEATERMDNDDIDQIKFKELHSEILEELLHFIYTNSLINASKCAKSMIIIAEKYKLPDLKAYCEEHLVLNLSPHNLSETLLVANSHKCTQLKSSVLKYCKMYHDQIFKDDGWKQMEKEEPRLYDEVVTNVIGDEYSLCAKHLECLQLQARNRKQTFVKISYPQGKFVRNILC